MPAVKTAISVEQDLFKQVEELAVTMNVSRSRVFALAAEEFVRRRENQALLEKINASYDDTPDPEEEKFRRAAQRSSLRVLDPW